MFRRNKQESQEQTEPSEATDDQEAQSAAPPAEKRVVAADDPVVTGAQSAPASTAPEQPRPSETSEPSETSGTDDTVVDPGAADAFGADESFGRRSAWYVLRKSVREFLDDSGTDMAASLTYYAVLSIFPGLLALLSLVGIFGNGEKSVNTVLDVLRPLVSSKTLADIHDPLVRLSHSEAATATFAIGIVGALWSASSWVRAFSRAMNRIYEVDEGRPFWRLYPMTYLLTIVTVVLSAAVLVILGASGPVARSLGDKLGLGDQAVDVWNWAKWPVLVLIVVVIIAMLYHFTPNVKPPKFRVLSVGAFVALLVWVIASAAFALYVTNFGSYDKTYGSVAGVVIALLWLWLTHVALLFGAELDAEFERARELHHGLEAESRILLPERSRRGIEKAAARREKDAERGREIRAQRVGAGDPQDRPF